MSNWPIETDPLTLAIQHLNSSPYALTKDECIDVLRKVRDQQPTLSQAAKDVVRERARQVTVEGWTPEHDDEHADGSLAEAAACYALGDIEVSADNESVPIWPWDIRWFKPEGDRRNLVKAGALILAEIERLDRVALATKQEITP